MMFTCDDCGGIFDDEQISTNNRIECIGVVICEDCEKNYFYECSGCGEMIVNDEVCSDCNHE